MLTAKQLAAKKLDELKTKASGPDGPIWLPDDGEHLEGMKEEAALQYLADFFKRGRQCEGCGALVPPTLGGEVTSGGFYCCPACAFNPPGCRCRFGDFGVPETGPTY